MRKAAEFWMADYMRQWFAEAAAKIDPMLVKGNGAKESLVEYDCPVCGKLKVHIETEPVGHGPGSGTRFRYKLEPLEEEAMYKLPQAAYDEIMASTTSLAAGLKLLAKEYRVLEDLRKSQAKSRAESRAKTLSEVAHESKPCIHCLTPQRRAARFSELVRIVSELDKTADGVPITPKTELWQAHPMMHLDGHSKPHPWSYPPGQSWQRDSTLLVYSTKEAARKAELETN